MSTDHTDAETNDAEATNSDESGNSVYRREPARRAFTAELSDAAHIFRESDKERAPKYALLPTGEQMNRCFFIGTLLNITHVGENGGMVRARLIDGSRSSDGEGNTGIYAYAGKYTPEAAAALEDIEPPEYVAIVGKPDTFDPDDGDTIVSLQPESVTVVSEDERNKWLLDTARSTLDRINRFENEESAYGEQVAEQYGTDMTKYRSAVQCVLENAADD